MVQALLERVPAAAARRLGDDARTPRRARRTASHYWFLTDEEFDERLAAGDFLEYHVVPVGPALRDARAPSSTGSPPRATCRCSSSS